MESLYAYRFISKSNKWGFVPYHASNTQLNEHGAAMVPLETWTLSTGNLATLYLSVYGSKFVSTFGASHIDENGNFFPGIPHTRYSLYKLAETTNNGNIIEICSVYHDINRPQIINLISRNHSRGCEPRYGELNIATNWDQLVYLIKDVAYIKTINTIKHLDSGFFIV